MWKFSYGVQAKLSCASRLDCGIMLNRTSLEISVDTNLVLGYTARFRFRSVTRENRSENRFAWKRKKGHFFLVPYVFLVRLFFFWSEKSVFSSLISLRSENNLRERRQKISPFFRSKRKRNGSHFDSSLASGTTGRSGGDDPVRVGGDGEPERRTSRLRGGQAARPATVRHSQSGFRRGGKRRQRRRFLQRRRRWRHPCFSGRVLCGPGLFLKLCSGSRYWGSGSGSFPFLIKVLSGQK